MIETINTYRNQGWKVGANKNDQLLFSKLFKKGKPEKFFALSTSPSVVDYARKTQFQTRKLWPT